MNKELYDELSDTEKEQIKYYLETYNDAGRIDTSLKDILYFWNEEKRDLYQLLGNQLMVSKQIEYKKSFSEIVDDFKAQWGTIANDFIVQCRNFFEGILPDELFPYRYDLRNFYNLYTLAENKYRGRSSFKIELPNGEIMAIQNGMKPLKALAKLNKVYHFCDEESFEEFRIFHSQILNQKKLSGDLTISIHPLDYMTMSDNWCGWRSCMSWENEGCYRMGTVEMMNSPIVVVAYLTADKDMKIKNLPWNSKKWRQLFIVNDELIASIKSYPYENDTLTKEVIYFLNELAKKNWDGCNYHTEKLLDYENESGYYFDFQTDYMYNDFGTTTHYIALKDLDQKEYDINYSGTTECMCCGGEIYHDDYDEDDADTLCCNNCSGHVHCFYCSDRIDLDRDGYYYLDGNLVCRSCYSEYAVREFGTDEIHHRDSMRQIEVCGDLLENPITTIYSSYHKIPNYLNNGEADIHTREVTWRWGSSKVTYIYYRDLKPEWQEYLDNDYDSDEV